MTQRPYKICVNAICKNEEQQLEAWLNTLSEADYIAILDTGSTDNTWNKLQQLQQQDPRIILKQEKIEPFYFDVARNKALLLVPADADYILCLDFDERISPNWHSAFDKIETEDNIFRFYRRDVSPQGVGRYVPMSRILKNNHTVMWYYPVHETLAEINSIPLEDGPILDIYIDHFEDNNFNKWHWYNQLLEQKLQYPEAKFGALECLSYQYFLLHDYQKAWFFMKQAQTLYDETTSEQRLKWGWNNWWIQQNWNDYKKCAKKICIYTICRNEKENIAKWLISVKNADYICILDTGSTDGTIDIIKTFQNDPNYTTPIIFEQQIFTPFRFDTARNASIQLVPDDADICWCLDVDERPVIDNWDYLIRQAWTDDCKQLNYKFAVSLNPDGTPSSVIWYDKITSNVKKEWYWKSPIHERRIYNGTDPFKSNSLNTEKPLVYHYQTPNPGNRDQYMNLILMRADEEPNDPYGLQFLLVEYANRSMWKEMVDVITNRLIPTINSDTCEFAGIGREECLQNAYRHLSFAYRQLGKDFECYIAIDRSIQSDPTSLPSYLVKAEYALQDKKPDVAIKTVLQGLQTCYRRLNWQENEDDWTTKPFMLLTQAYYMTKQYTQAYFAALTAKELGKAEDTHLQHNIDVCKAAIERND